MNTVIQRYYVIAPLSWLDNCLHVLTRFQTGTNVVKINMSSSLWKLAKQQMLLLEIAGTSASLDEKHLVKKKIVPCIDSEIKKGISYCLMFFIPGEL